MFICIIRSEEEYLDLIADLSRYGLHDPNVYADLDKDNMSVVDSFNRLPPSMAERWLGIRDYEKKITTEIEDGKEWEVETVRGLGDSIPLNRKKLHIGEDLREHIRIPEAKDYPILIMWDWGDDFDRCGDIKTRYFDWLSMSEIPDSHSENGKSIIKNKARLWRNRYGKKLQELVEAQKRRYYGPGKP